MQHMKKITPFLLMLFGLCHLVQAQTTGGTPAISPAKILQAQQLVSGPNRNPAKAFELFSQYAAQGSAEAMNALGILYDKGIGTTASSTNAISWFKKALDAGYIKAAYNLGMAYKQQLNFSQAYKYIVQAATTDAQAAYAQAYMLYKGFGCQQSYQQAFMLFAKGAAAGMSNSMYYTGLCYRNGYGIPVNTDSARYWLAEAAKKGNTMADEELRTAQPENLSMAGTLKEVIQEAQAAMPQKQAVNTYQKIKNTIPVAAVAGIYKGYLLKYDWSGSHVVEATPMEVQIRYENDSIKGLWQEGDSLSIPLNAKLTTEAMMFDKMQYSKINHYSDGKPELAIFQQAKLQLTQAKGQVYIGGNIQQFIPSRNEPAKPQFLALVRTAATVTDTSQQIRITHADGTAITTYALRAYPNPFASIINLDFTLTTASVVSTQLLTLEGKVVCQNQAGKLQAGSYTLPIQTQQLAAGTYLLVLTTGNHKTTTKVLKQ